MNLSGIHGRLRHSAQGGIRIARRLSKELIPNPGADRVEIRSMRSTAYRLIRICLPTDEQGLFAFFEHRRVENSRLLDQCFEANPP